MNNFEFIVSFKNLFNLSEQRLITLFLQESISPSCELTQSVIFPSCILIQPVTHDVSNIIYSYFLLFSQEWISSADLLNVEFLKSITSLSHGKLSLSNPMMNLSSMHAGNIPVPGGKFFSPM